MALNNQRFMIYRISLLGFTLSLATILIGLTLYIAVDSELKHSYQGIAEENYVYLESILLSDSSIGLKLVVIGVITLIATPIAILIYSAIYYHLKGDRVGVAITIAILATIIGVILFI